MKKLLSILATSSIVVSAPLSVIACNNNTTNPEEEFDFDAVKNEMISTVGAIFQKNLKNDFDKFYSLYEKNEIFENWMVEDFAEKAEDFNDIKSDAFVDVSNTISSKVINWNNIISEVNSQVVKNINFSQLLINSQNPLKGGFSISTIKVVSKPLVNSVTLQVGIQSSVAFKDKTGEEESEDIKFESLINIFGELDTAKLFDQAKENYFNLINDEINANNFTYKSDKGNLKNSATAIKTDLELKNNINTLIDKVVSDTGGFERAGEVILTTSEADSRDSSVVYTKVEYVKNHINLRNALWGDKEIEDRILDDLGNNDSSFANQPVETKIPDIDNKIEGFQGMAKAMNPFNLEYNYSNVSKATFKDLLEKQGSKFVINPEKDENVIALFKAEISNFKIKFLNTEFELPKVLIGVRQKLNQIANTKELVSQFYSDSWFLLKALFNIDENTTQESNPDLVFYINKPERWNEIPAGTSVLASDYFDDLIDSNPEALAIAKKLELTPILASSTYLTNTSLGSMRITEDGYVHFYSETATNPQNFNVRISYFSSGLANSASKSYFSFGTNIDRLTVDQIMNNAPSGMKFK
ncbi:hypothetical protein SSABA_v1c09200 [Spiroplasma sabaudiense Ar-1343]|uniref:Lipoprotein n=1 Tax=Spiroplasma sabaudiense Ar-1343 TaxID=1276257 RepID=W6AKS4_9MOLU|nr:hypothetical protein [Spiroplasma sabaudiense]AHI54319.1 hypothetical protein SSABA_v1c09200 [Spiroplasma sabaudiense Ar-1343]